MYTKRKWQTHYWNNGDGDRCQVYSGVWDEDDLNEGFVFESAYEARDLQRFLNENETVLETLHKRIEELETQLSSLA